MIVGGLNDADAPAGSPETLNPSVCATPLVTVVLIVLVADWPPVTAAPVGLALIEKSFTAGLNIATAAAQYILVRKLPVKFCALVNFATLVAATMLATLLPARLVCCGWAE